MSTLQANSDAPLFPLMAFVRHRLGLDGQGVTSLAAAWGCPLACRWCLNPQCADPATPVRRVTPEALYDMAKVDDLYFQATLGGVTFGGGEPLMHADFIAAFRALCGARWRLTVETSLNVPSEQVAIAAGCVDEFIVDIKDMDEGLYRAYTGGDNAAVVENLAALLGAIGADRIVARVPLIPGHNTAEDVRRSIQRLRRMGMTRVNTFTYRVNGGI